MEAILQAENITKSFGGLTALNSVDLKVSKGEIVSLIGPNGAGKTTLFNVLTGTFLPDSGYVFFQGEDLTHLPPYTRCKLGLTRTFQIPRPFSSLSVIDNVTVGALVAESSPKKARSLAYEVLDHVGIRELAPRIASELTVANRKRMELARALATTTKMVLLDEIMSGLNPKEMDTILSLIESIRSGGTTVLVIEHIMDAVMRISDRIYVLNEGMMIAEGTPFEVAKDPQVVKAYLGEDYELSRS